MGAACATRSAGRSSRRAVLEGWAADREAAAAALAAGEVALRSRQRARPRRADDRRVLAVDARVGGRGRGAGVRAFSTLNEGPGRTLWFGVGDDEAVATARFLRDRARAAAGTAARAHAGRSTCFDLAAQGLHMGDELHMRSQATTNLLWRRLLPAFAAEGGEDVAAALHRANHLFFLNLGMAAAKCASLAARAARGLDARHADVAQRDRDGAPARRAARPLVHGARRAGQDALLREGFAPADAALDIGDSAVLECVGLGGMARRRRAGGRGVLRRRRGRRGGALAAHGRDLRGALGALHAAGARPRGQPGRDRRAARRRARHRAADHHRRAARARDGAGQIGAGIAHQPLEPFRAALTALVEALE